MATSGSVDYNRTRVQITERALRIASGGDPGEAVAAEDTNIAVEALNVMVKAWQGDGVHLWKRIQATLFLTAAQSSYELGPSSSDHVAANHEIARTKLTAAGVANDVALTVASITGIAASDQLGVVLDDGTLHWTTVNGAPSGTTVTATAGLASAAAIGNYVYAYTNALARPLRVTEARRRRETSDQDSPILVQSHREYFDLPNKTSTGPPNLVYYQPEIRNGRGTIYIWPVPTNVADTLQLTAQIPFEDFDAASNDPDFPVEWINALTWNLANELVPEFGAPELTERRIARRAVYYYQKVLTWDAEPVSVYFQPNLTHQQGG